jgi:cytochrome c551
VKKGGKGLSVTVWSAIALGAIGIGVILAFLAGYFLGHFTGHDKTTTVSVVTSPQVEAEDAEAEESATEEAEAEEAATEEAEEAEAEEAEAEEAEEAEGAEETEGGEKEAEGGEEASGAAGNPEAGAEVFATNCSVCHGSSGHGGAGGPDLRTMPKAKTEAGVIEQVTNGGGGMPPFKGQLSEEEISNVAAFVVQDVVGGG